jgi:hypothetical protein
MIDRLQETLLAASILLFVAAAIFGVDENSCAMRMFYAGAVTSIIAGILYVVFG